MGKKDAPPPPDYTPLAQASQAQVDLARDQMKVNSAQADRQFGLQQNALDWAKGEFAKNDATTDKVTQAQLDAQNFAMENARKAQSRYESIYQPLEDQAVQTAKNYDSPENERLQAGAAQATVAQQFGQARVAAAQNLESFGIDPSATRYAALDVGGRIAQAAASAAAGNQSVQQTQATARALQANAINVGRGLASDVNAGTNTSVNAGSSAVNAGNQTANTGGNIMGTSTQYGALGSGLYGNATGALNAGTNAIGTWGSTLNNGYNAQLGAFNAQQNASSGIGSALGLAASFIPGLAEGGAVPASASPTRGKAVDDVPARLTPGEFVIPKDVVAWKGEEHFQKFIQKSREDRKANSPAQPKAMAVPAQPAVFSSRALPVR